MHFDFKGIMQGAFNSIFVREEIEKIADERINICRECPHDSESAKKLNPDLKNKLRPDEHCGLCGCNLHMKTRSLSQVCPDKPPRWDKVVEEQQEWVIDQALYESDNRNKKRKHR